MDDLELGGEPREFDLGDQDDVDELVERIQVGSAAAVIDNDFPVGVSGTITIGDRTRDVVIAPEATSEVTISYTRAELQELLSGPITYSWTGSVTGTGEHRGDAAGRPRQFLIHTRVTDDLEIADYVNGGSGIGLDLGLMLSLDRLFVGAAVHNLFNTFAWDESLLTYRRVTAAFEDGSLSFDHATPAYAEAPEEARELIAELTFKPALRFGVAYLLVDALTVSSDVHYRFGDGIALDPQFHLGLGMEYRPIDFLHLRGGLAVQFGLSFGNPLPRPADPWGQTR